MIDYVGDVSRRDAELLCALAKRSDRILEFGCGASTQIFCAYGRDTVESVETDPEWIERTKINLALLRMSRPIAFIVYDGFLPGIGYDLIFVDGIDELRADFAFRAWPGLAIGGMMCFHDTRRTKPHGESLTSDVQNVCALIERYSTEIDRVVLNQCDSNITVVTKRAPLPLEDWNAVEGRTLEQIGLA